MTIAARALSVDLDEDQIWMRLEDGRTAGVPLAWLARLLHGTDAARPPLGRTG